MGDSDTVNDQLIIKESLKKMKKKLKNTSITFLKIFIAWLLNLILGSLLFIYIEQCVREQPRPLSDVETAWKRTCDMVAKGNNSFVLKEQWNDSNIFELTKMCEEVVVITDDRRCAYDANNFAHYLDYTYSIAFTIGFGHVVPYSDLGKIVTMLYALPAVGLTLVLYSYAADILIMVTYLVTAKIEKRFLNKIRICKYKTTMVQVFLSLFGFFGMSIILMLEGERKTLDNFYLCFISLTTIGFGDIIYSSKDSLKNPWIYVPQLIVFLFTMATVASTLSAVSELLKKNKLGKWFSKKRHVNKSKINDKKSTKRHSDGYTTA